MKEEDSGRCGGIEATLQVILFRHGRTNSRIGGVGPGSSSASNPAAYLDGTGPLSICSQECSQPCIPRWFLDSEGGGGPPGGSHCPQRGGGVLVNSYPNLPDQKIGDWCRTWQGRR